MDRSMRDTRDATRDTPPLAAVLLTAIAGFALAGCDTRGSPTEQGELSDGTFHYVCTGTSDSICDEGTELPVGFPSVALDAEFTATYTPSSSRSDPEPNTPPYLDTVAPERVEIVGDIYAEPPTLHTHITGFTALVIRDDLEALDFLHVEVKPADSLEVFRVGSGSASGSIGSIDFTITGTISDKLRVTMKAKDGSLLAGSLLCAWSSSDPGVVEITSAPTDNFISIRTKSAGTTTMTVTLGDLTTEFPIKVEMP